MTYALAFGSYTIPNTITLQRVSMARNVPSAKTPRYDGARTLSGMLELKRFSLQGSLIRQIGSTDVSWLRNQLDALKGALAVQGANFTVDSDRYWRQCYAEQYEDSFAPTGAQRIVDVSFDVVTGDPFSYETATQSGGGALVTSGQTKTVVNGGNAPGAPRLSLTVGSTGTLSATITNQTTVDVCTLFGPVTSGDVIIVDSLLETVTRSGLDVTSLFDGQFPRLEVGSNVFRFDWVSGSLNNAAIAWNNRFF